MSEEKLVVIIMGQNCEKFIPMCLESVKDADAIVYCDGGSTDNSGGLIADCELTNIRKKDKKWGTPEIIENAYDQDDPKMNGRQRNFYLDYIKENYPGWWCLALDADEVVDTDGIKKLKEFINFIPKENNDILFSPKMRHLIGDLAHEDSTLPNHFVPNRLFKIRDELIYPEVEHSVLGHEGEMRMQNLILTTIWHMAYAPNLWDIKKRYECHMKKSQMHTPEWLRSWYKAFLFGEYPNTKFSPLELPDVILNEFDIDKDELYFHNRRQMEAKHYQDAIDWKKFFKCKNALLFGCGFGQRVRALIDIGVDAVGVEISKYAITHSLVKDKLILGSIIDFNLDIGNFDLTTAYDILEHLKYEDLDKAITTLKTFSKKYILVSVPFKGSKDLDADPSHVIKEDRDWWVEKFISRGLKEVEVPEHFMWKEQLLIFKK